MVKTGRPAKIPDAKCLELLKQGLSNAQIKREFDKLGVDVTPEAVRLKRKKFEEQYRERGEVPPWETLPKTTIEAVDIKPTEELGLSLLEGLISAVESANNNRAMFDLLSRNESLRNELSRFTKEAKEMAELKRELRKYKEGYKNMREYAERLAEGKLAKQQGVTAPPLLSADIHSSLESQEQLHSNMGDIESISHNIYDYTTQYLISNYGIQYNIKLDAFCFN